MNNACDAHIHVIDPRFAVADGSTPAPGRTLADWQRMAGPLGLSRAVVVQAKVHGTDPACLLDALAQLQGRGRGIAVADTSVSDAELQQWHAAGVRGLRFSLWNPADAVVSLAMIEPLAQRIAELGWHAQLHMSAEQILEAQGVIRRLPVPVVFDHLGRLPPAAGTAHPAFGFIAERLAAGQAWVKLSGAYLNTRIGAPAYPDASDVACAYLSIAPERLVWGSDWPHVTEADHPPSDAGLRALLDHWTQSAALTRQVLVDNPARLYGWPV